VLVLRSTKAGGPRWAAASTARGPITNYAKQVLATAGPVAQERAERQHRLRQQQADQAFGLAAPHSAAVPPSRAHDPVPSLHLPSDTAPVNAPRPQSARGTVAGGLLPHKAHLWSTPDVGKWLDSLGLSRYADTFDENEIAGAILVDMTAEDLDYLDVKVLAHRKLLLKGITKLKQAIEAGDASGMSLPTPRSPPAHAYRMAPEGQQQDNVGTDSAPSPAPGANMVHWSALQPLAPQGLPEGGAMSVQGAPAQSSSLADMAYGDYDEAAEQAAFREAVMAWRGGSGAAPGSALATAAAATAPAGTKPGDSAEGWSNPADASAPSTGGRFTSTLGAKASSSGAFSSTLGGQTAPLNHSQASVQISRTADAGSSTANSSHNSTAGRFNTLLHEGPDEEAEHAAFRDAVLAWRGEPALQASSGAAPQASHATSGENLAAPSATLSAGTAKVLGVDPSTVEGSTWYAGYKTLFAGGEGGGSGSVQAFNEHVRALHEARRKARGAESGNMSSSTGAHAAAQSPLGGGHVHPPHGGKEEETEVTSPHVAVQEDGGESSFVQARVTTSRGGARSGPVANTTKGGAGGIGDSPEGDIEDMDDLPQAPHEGAPQRGGLISLVDLSALDGFASPAVPAGPLGTETGQAGSPSAPLRSPGGLSPQPARSTPRDIWSVEVDY